MNSEGGAFAVVPDEAPDPAPACGRVGWIDLCGDKYDSHHVYRSHLQFNTGSIPAGAQVISASMTWTSDGDSPRVTLYLPLQMWNGEPLSLFSLPVKKLDPNSPKKEILQAVLSWRESPKYNYGIVVTGSDESMDCQGNWHAWKICDIKIEGEMMVSEAVD